MSSKTTDSKTEKYLIFSHFDEHYENGAIHLITIENCGTALELMDDTPEMPYRAYCRSGLSNAIISFEQFPKWFDWFQAEHLRDESFELEVTVKDDDLVDLLTDMGIDFTLNC